MEIEKTLGCILSFFFFSYLFIFYIEIIYNYIMELETEEIVTEKWLKKGLKHITKTQKPFSTGNLLSHLERPQWRNPAKNAYCHGAHPRNG